MNAKDFRTELELRFSRNLAILIENTGEANINGVKYVATDDVRDMLKACAANTAQAYAGRIAEPPCERCSGKAYVDVAGQPGRIESCACEAGQQREANKRLGDRACLDSGESGDNAIRGAGRARLLP